MTTPVTIALAILGAFAMLWDIVRSERDEKRREKAFDEAWEARERTDAD